MNEEPWKLTVHEETKTEDAIFIEGLPGIGNVGKVVVDYLIEKSEATLIADLFSRTLPNSVFVNEDNLVELPKIQIYHARIKKQDYLFMTGDVQPADEVASYHFCEAVLEQLTKAWKSKIIITLGGIGLQEPPQEPQVYCTGNGHDGVKKFAEKGANMEVYGVVGPIIGVSGLLLGLAKEKDLPAVSLLAETLGHPMYLGLRGARSILKLFQKTYGLDYPLDDLENEIHEMEEEEPGIKQKNPKLDTINRLKRYRDMNYIG